MPSSTSYKRRPCVGIGHHLLLLFCIDLWCLFFLFLMVSVGPSLHCQCQLFYGGEDFRFCTYECRKSSTSSKCWVFSDSIFFLHQKRQKKFVARMVIWEFEESHVALFLNNQPDTLIIPILFCCKILHGSGIFSAHNQEFSIVHSAVVSFMQDLMTVSK